MPRPISSGVASAPLRAARTGVGGGKLNGRWAIVEAPLGRGRVVLFGFRPQYRARTWSTFKYLFNSLYYATMDHGPADRKP
jgi:hypothetical protein